MEALTVRSLRLVEHAATIVEMRRFFSVAILSMFMLTFTACNRPGACLETPTEPARTLVKLNRSGAPLPVLEMDASSESAFRASELPNPTRGLYTWLGQTPQTGPKPGLSPTYSSSANVAPFAAPSPDDYRRIPWRWFYKQDGKGFATNELDFSSLDYLLDQAVPPGSGRKLHFGVMPVNGKLGDTANEPWWRGNSATPDFLREALMAQNPPQGFYAGDLEPDKPENYSTKPNPDWTFWPDWNSETYIREVERFVRALSEHRTSLGVPLRDDPRLGSLEVRLYGAWGEWHTAPVDYGTVNRALGLNLREGENDPDKPEGVRRKIIEAYANAFPKKRLILLTGAQDNVKMLRWAFSSFPNVGWRRDSFLTKLFETHTDGNARNGGFDFRDALIRDRWMTAPVWVERGACGPTHTSLGVRQVEDFHISGIGNQIGDRAEDAWSKQGATRQREWRETALRAGFRLIVSKLEVPTTAKLASSMNINLTWENVGVAPLYEPFQVQFELRQPGSSTAIWRTTSSFDLRTLLPANTDIPDELKSKLVTSPFVARDTLNLPSTLKAGPYELWLKAVDASEINPRVPNAERYRRKPLWLAHPGRSSDGAYRLGQITLERP